ncbi:unnamed protein product [Ectocarpus sp. 12 AP-2014]
MRSLAWTGHRAASSLLFARSSTFLPTSNRLVRPTPPPANLVLKCSWSKRPNKMDFRVATYNILCSHLAEPTRFPQCSPRNLDAPTRLKRVKHKLDAEISKGSVICLQEVGIQWAGDLHVYFMARGYAFVTAHYGKHFNNYMGVALAWPLDKYECLTVDTTRLSDTRRWGREPRQEREEREAKQAAEPPSTPVAGPPPAMATPVLKSVWGRLGALMNMNSAERGMKRPREADSGSSGNSNGNSNGNSSSNGKAAAERERAPENPWQIAERRFNQVLFARLRPKTGSADLPNGGTFCVGTYHMPCLFNVRPVMVMHTSLAIRHLAKLAGPDPLVFAGDFNFNPDSDCYKLAVEGDLPESSGDFPVRPEWEKDWTPKTGVCLQSAYKQVDGKEPDFTNNAKVEDWDPFIDTLDYIFHTPGITAIKVLPLKHRSEVNGPFPVSEEPSDHVILAAEFKIDRPVAAEA